LTPKAQALDRLATFDAGSYGLREAGKLLGVPQNEFLMYLKAKGWIYKITGQKDWLATSVVCKRQLMDHKMIEGDKAGGGRWQRTTAVITARGMAKLAFDLKSKPDADRLAA
jgi:phage antirepressor YoqD-like protein